MDISRRRFLRPGANKTGLRPPWLLNPASFVDDCSRCGECITRCPEQVLVAGDGGFPEASFSWGECTFCGDCTKHCEKHLFNPDSEALPWSYVAFVAESCLSYRGIMCRSCEDACEPRAIRFPLVVGAVPVPIINNDACTGCGACVAPCPEQAISVA